MTSRFSNRAVDAAVRSLRSRVGLAAALAAALSVGCGLSLTFGPSIVNHCSPTMPCGEGECVEGMCISTSLDEPLRVAFEVVVPSAPTEPVRAPVLFAPVDVSSPLEHDLVVPYPVTVTGGAFFGEPAVRVPVKVTFRAQPAFPGDPGSSVEVTSDAYDFAVLLEADRVYDVAVEPLGLAVAGLAAAVAQPSQPDPSASDFFPPLYATGISPTELVDHRLDFVYPTSILEPCTILAPDGCTLAASVKSVDAVGDELAEAGLRASAIDVNGRTVSSSVLSDGAGGFVIRISPDAGVYSLRVTPPESSLLPGVVVGVDLALAPAERNVFVPRLPSITLNGFVGYDDGGVVFVDGAAVSFESVGLDDLSLGGAMSFRRVTVSSTVDDMAGRFSVGLLPGTYRVVVTPSQADRAGVLVTEVTIDERSPAEISGQHYLLPLRTSLSGTVLTPMREPVALATIRASRLPAPAALDAGDVLRFGRSSETAADLEGQYRMPIDGGLFDLVVRPGAGTGYAWELFPAVEVLTSERDRMLDLPISAPVPIAGFVRDILGGTPGEVLVRAYAIVGTGPTARAVQVGETTADETGAYEMLLPGGLH